MSPSSGGMVSIWFSYSDSLASLVRPHRVDGNVRSWFLNIDLQTGGQRGHWERRGEVRGMQDARQYGGHQRKHVVHRASSNPTPVQPPSP